MVSPRSTSRRCDEPIDMQQKATAQVGGCKPLSADVVHYLQNRCPHVVPGNVMILDSLFFNTPSLGPGLLRRLDCIFAAVYDRGHWTLVRMQRRDDAKTMCVDVYNPNNPSNAPIDTQIIQAKQKIRDWLHTALPNYGIRWNIIWGPCQSQSSDDSGVYVVLALYYLIKHGSNLPTSWPKADVRAYLLQMIDGGVDGTDEEPVRSRPWRRSRDSGVFADESPDRTSNSLPSPISSTTNKCTNGAVISRPLDGPDDSSPCSTRTTRHPSDSSSNSQRKPASQSNGEKRPPPPSDTDRVPTKKLCLREPDHKAALQDLQRLRDAVATSLQNVPAPDNMASKLCTEQVRHGDIQKSVARASEDCEKRRREQSEATIKVDAAAQDLEDYSNYLASRRLDPVGDVSLLVKKYMRGLCDLAQKQRHELLLTRDTAHKARQKAAVEVGRTNARYIAIKAELVQSAADIENLQGWMVVQKARECVRAAFEGLP